MYFLERSYLVEEKNLKKIFKYVTDLSKTFTNKSIALNAVQ